ncbi:MAG: cytochrome b/b6 domain-containing protein [candidate division NC10 bacterium]|nr:cytochrome b/b6 domain-containing protein [candidate division NC10 bacterium]
MPDRDVLQRQRESLGAAMTDILDTVHPPVARFRLMSLGMSPALRTESFRDVVGDKGCLSCGNCVDACPVMAKQFGPIVIPNMRTSMALEHLVADQCLRFFACIRACPQTDRGLKEFALAYRRGEKVTHALLATAFLSLSLSGIALFHFREAWPEAVIHVLGVLHRIAAPALALTPLVYLWLDRLHLGRRLRQIASWGRADVEWLRQWWRAVRSRGRVSLPAFGESHPGRKAWQLSLGAAFLVFAATGSALWIGEGTLGKSLIQRVAWVHSRTAMVMDVWVAIHLVRVLVRPALQRLRRMLALHGHEADLLVERAQFLG